MPVLAKGDKYAFGRCSSPSPTATQGLTPEQLYKKCEVVFATAQRYAQQFPVEHFSERVIPHREWPIRTLCYHVFRIGESFLETWNGAEYSVKIADNEPPDEIKTGRDIAAYGASVWKRYEAWRSGVEDRSLSKLVKTYFGEVPAAKLFERVIWHSAQHCRQLVSHS